VDADIIYVFRDGVVAESGTHAELLKQGGLYAQMWERQIGFALSDDGLHATVEPERLAKFPFFRGLEPERLTDVAALFSTETCKQGETVVHEGEKGDKFYIIVRGKVEVVKGDAVGDADGGAAVGASVEGKRVAVLQDGDHFGEIALLRGIPRTATVRALEPSVLLGLRREAFLKLTQSYPHILEAVERTLRERM
jgi:ATP-binding cassette subfamily B protein